MLLPESTGMRVASFLHRVMTSVACLALPRISTLSHKRHDFQEEKELLNIKCVLLDSLQLLPGIFLIRRRIQQAVI